MRFTLTGARRYHHSGGDILDRGRLLDLAHADRLRRFFADQVVECWARQDGVGAEYCVQTAQQLNAALQAATAWRRASGPLRR